MNARARLRNTALKLTQKITHKNGLLTTTLTFEGREVEVYNGAGTALKVIELFGDDDLCADVKAEVLAHLLFVEPYSVVRAFEGDYSRLLAFVLFEVVTIDIDGKHATAHARAQNKRVIDWEQDADIINVSLRMAYGVCFADIAQQVDFREFCKMLSFAPRDTPISQAMYYRSAKPPAYRKGNEQAVREFNRLRKYWALDTEQDSVNTIDGAFNRLKEMAKNG